MLESHLTSETSQGSVKSDVSLTLPLIYKSEICHKDVRCTFSDLYTIHLTLPPGVKGCNGIEGHCYKSLICQC